MSDDYSYLFKMIVTGDSGVGKSCLTLRFSDDEFSNDHLCTIGIDFRVPRIHLDDKICKLQIWDTAGQERFKSITSKYYRGKQGVIVVYDVTDMKSFLNVKKWFQEAEEYECSCCGPMSKLLIGNKSDLNFKRVVSYADGEELADSLGVQFIETSAKNSENVEKAFVTMCANIKKNLEHSNCHQTETNKKIQISKSTVKNVFQKGRCDC